MHHETTTAFENQEHTRSDHADIAQFDTKPYSHLRQRRKEHHWPKRTSCQVYTSAHQRIL